VASAIAEQRACLRRVIEDALRALGLQLNVVAEIDSLPSVKKATEAGIGSTILPLGSVAEELQQASCRLARTPATDVAPRGLRVQHHAAADARQQRCHRGWSRR